MENLAQILIHHLRMLFALERISLRLVRKADKSASDTEFGVVLRAKHAASADQATLLKKCVEQVDGVLAGAASMLIDGAESELKLLLSTLRKGTERDLKMCCIIQTAVHCKLSLCETAIAQARALNQPDVELYLLEYLGEERTFDSSLSLWRDTAIAATPAIVVPAT